MAEWKKGIPGRKVRDLLVRMRDSGVFEKLLEDLSERGKRSLLTMVSHYGRLAERNASRPDARIREDDGGGGPDGGGGSGSDLQRNR